MCYNMQLEGIDALKCVLVITGFAMPAALVLLSGCSYGVAIRFSLADGMMIYDPMNNSHLIL